MKTLLEVLDSGTQYLKNHGIEEARLNMQLLLCHTLKCDRITLYCDHDRPLSDEELQPLRQLLRKRGEGIPLQHLTGSTNFLGRDFRTDARALVPRPETEILTEFLCSYAKNHFPQGGKLIDVGTGSGIIGISLALELNNFEVILSDIQPAALDLARENAQAHAANVRLIRSDLLNELSDQKFDIIVANLPYIADSEKTQLAREVLCDPHSALFGGPVGDELIEKLILQAPHFLTENGIIALEVGYDQGEKILSRLKELGYQDAQLQKDLDGIARFPIAKCPLQSEENNASNNS